MKYKRALNFIITAMFVNMALLSMLTITDYGPFMNAQAAKVETGDVYAAETDYWYINQSTVYRNTSLTVNCNISMGNWGSLVIDNTTMYLECPVNTSWLLGKTNVVGNDTNATGLKFINSYLYINNTAVHFEFVLFHILKS